MSANTPKLAGQDEAQATYDSSDRTSLQWNKLRQHLEQESLHPQETIRMPSSFQQTRIQELLKELPGLTGQNAEADSFEAASAEIELGGVIGRGGMGAIYDARQRSLQREVAVKVLHPSKDQPEDVKRLLQESYVTGLLEHPNIVPVHQLGVDAQQKPLIVMKRIDGLRWLDLLPVEKAPEELFEGKARDLDWHIQILIQVCHAVEFAHSRGILHLDLKPDNVMIGEFGEIYLLDWGIAVSFLQEPPNENIPRAEEVDKFIGTPWYMAPEMLQEDGRLLTKQTDVYLLGAVLHKLLTGSPPHKDKGLLDLLRDMLFPPERFDYDKGLPQELVALCKRALSHEPEERPASAKAFRQALEQYLKHRDSSKVSEQANQLLFQLRKNIMSFKEPIGEQTKASHHTVYSLYWRCHFGLSHALETWPDNGLAQHRFQTLLEAMADFELNRDNPKAASLFLSELSTIPEALAARYREAEAKHRKKTADAKELERLQYENSLFIGSVHRRNVLVIVGAIWSILSFGAYFLESTTSFRVTNKLMLGLNICFLGSIFLAAVIWRKHLLTNEASREMIRMLYLAAAVFLIQRFFFMQQGIPANKALLYEFIVFFLLLATFANAHNLYFFFPACGYLLGLAGSLLYEEGMFLFWGMGHLQVIVFFGLFWSSERIRTHELELRKSRSQG